MTDPNSKPIRCILCDRPKGAMKELYRENDKWAHMGKSSELVHLVYFLEFRKYLVEYFTGL